MSRNSNSTGFGSQQNGDSFGDPDGKKKSLLRHLMFLGAWIVVFGMEFLYRKPLLNRSIELQEDLQNSITNGGIVVFKGLSYFGDGIPYFLAFGFMFNWQTRSRAFYYILYISTCGFLMNITKMAYSEPRPFMLSPLIRAYGCSAEYGNPSGHSLFAAAFSFFFFLDVCHGTKYKYSRPIYYSLLFIAIALTVMIGFARFYVGVHSLNQIVYGWQLGLLLAFYFHFCLRQPVIRHIDMIIEKRPIDLPYKKYIAVSTGLYIVGIASQILTYIFAQMILDQGNDEAKYLQNLLLQPDCAKYAGSNWVFNRKSVVICGLGVMSYGAYLGVLFQSRFFRTLDWPYMLKTSIVKFLLRIIIIVLLVAPFGVIFLVIPDDANLAVSIIFKTLIPLTLMLFCLFAFSNYFFVRFKIVNEANAGLLPIDQRLKQVKIFDVAPDEKHH